MKIGTAAAYGEGAAVAIEVVYSNALWSPRGDPQRDDETVVPMCTPSTSSLTRSRSSSGVARQVSAAGRPSWPQCGDSRRSCSSHAWPSSPAAARGCRVRRVATGYGIELLNANEQLQGSDDGKLIVIDEAQPLRRVSARRRVRGRRGQRRGLRTGVPLTVGPLSFLLLLFRARQ